MNLTCPDCNHERSDTLETRKINTTHNSLIKAWKGYAPKDCIVRRRHECRVCGHRWSTLQLSFDDVNNLRGVVVDKKIQQKTKAIQVLLKQIDAELRSHI